MCGIAGIVRFSGPPLEREPLLRAGAALRHRGPDRSSCWTSATAPPAVGLAATRLVVLDPSPAADQPMFDPSRRSVLVYNGEIYNFRRLRAELVEAGAEFRTEGDTEVVLAACARWGVEAFSRFNGMWALAFYDTVARCGFLSRDRFGVKPLLYSTEGGQLVFASELEALRRLDDRSRQTNIDAVLHHLLLGYIAHPETIYRDVSRLEPGHVLKFTANGPEAPTRYFNPLVSAGAPRGDGAGRNGEPGRNSYTESCAVLRRTIADAVAIRRVSDVPIGAFLSGGLDSSIVASRLVAAVGAPVQTFCVGYADQRSYDESRYARLVAERLGARHHEVRVTRREVLDFIPRVLDHLGEPVGDSSIIPTALLSQVARRYVTVALSGDGGDELFGGYWRYLGHRVIEAYRRVPAPIRRFLFGALARAGGVSRSSALGNRLRQARKFLRVEGPAGRRSTTGHDDPLARHIAWSRILSPEAAAALGSAEVFEAMELRCRERAHALTATLSGTDPLNRVLAFDLQYQLPADMLQKVDLASMMHSLEVRTPFLDPGVVRLALDMPADWKIDRGVRKRVLVDAYRGLLPDEVLDRPKQGFEVPVGEFFRGPLRELFFDTVTADVVGSFGMLSYAGVQRVFADHAARRADHADLLFALLSLCWWQRAQPR
ncbi:MAG: asparagine synthase (glutamine-hydrolyzing) [Planctomycetes bacterium]|nr:asparagine synthase (glutamine-hydrolyzing) [Planctomycetota bacterium]